MPELLEVEAYRRLAAGLVGRRITDVWVDPAFVRRGAGPEQVDDAAVGATVRSVDRVGKLLLVELADRPTLGLRFGMTGVLEIDGVRGVDDLAYASNRVDPRWVRLEVRAAGGLVLRVHDQRRFGGVELDPDRGALGPDAASLTPAQLRNALQGSGAPLKARLLDQARVAGLGNLLVDEILWRASLAPVRPAGSLDPTERRRLHHHLHRVLSVLGTRGGSHRGDLQEARVPGGTCPRDGVVLARQPVGGRTTYWCPHHQR